MAEEKTYAVVDENNIVLNVIVWDGVTSYSPGEGLRLIESDQASRDYTYNEETGEFTKPQPQVEQ